MNKFRLLEEVARSDAEIQWLTKKKGEKISLVSQNKKVTCVQFQLFKIK